MASVAVASKNAAKSVSTSVRKCLSPFRTGDTAKLRGLATSAARDIRPEESDSMVQDNGQGRQAETSRRMEFPSFFNGDPFFPARNFGLGQVMNVMDQLFDNPFISLSRGTGDVRGGLRKPWDALEDKEALRLRVDMPGLGKEDIKVYAEENSLVIKGEAQSEAELDGRGRKYNSRIDLPPKVYKLDQIKAEMKNGVLKVTVPKFKEDEMKNVINVKIE